MDAQSLLKEVPKLLSSLTAKRLMMLSWFILLCGTSLVLYETRQSIYNYVAQNRLVETKTPTAISKQSFDMLSHAVESSHSITSIRVMSVDFQRNVKTSIYLYGKDPDLNKIYNSIFVTEVPMFATSDIEENKMMVGLINGEFVCRPYDETRDSRMYPGSANHIKYACSLSIPPFFGKFSGYITLYTTKRPTVEEMDQLRVTANRFSSSLFNKDFI